MALGQVAYLIQVLAHRFKYKIPKYDFVLGGAQTKICIKSKPDQHFELFMPVPEAKFNQALIFLFDCV